MIAKPSLSLPGLCRREKWQEVQGRSKDGAVQLEEKPGGTRGNQHEEGTDAHRTFLNMPG